jgi:hypothetical protein
VVAAEDPILKLARWQLVLASTITNLSGKKYLHKNISISLPTLSGTKNTEYNKTQHKDTRQEES